MSLQSGRSVGADVVGTGLLAVLAVLRAFAAFSGGLWELVTRWSRQEEYGHGFFIPFIAAWMLWGRRDALIANIGQPSWTGPLLILLAAGMLFVGELSAF